MVEDIGKIKRELKKAFNKEQEEDSIKGKSVDRVLDTIARKIKNNKGPQPGTCHNCLKYEDRTCPVIIKICRDCAKKFADKTSGVKLMKVETQDYYCDMCLKRTFRTFMVNPRICQRCASNIGRFHQIMMPRIREQMERDKMKKPWNSSLQNS